MLVLDPGLQRVPNLFAGLKPESILVLNTGKEPTESPSENLKATAVVNASAIAIAEVGRNISNTCLMGAFCAATEWLKLESLLEAFKWYFSGTLLENNRKSATRGYNEVKVIQW
jgi:2-oxoacid:acceptor oxidoreductase gamma subunit (pyruvate/2-ketoisovalerate family)